MGCLSAPDEMAAGAKAVAEQTINVPYEDTYELLARYEQPYAFAAEFTVEVEQNGKVVASFPCGRLTDPKIWAFNNHERTPMERYTWSGTDNIVWQNPGNVKLAAGTAKLRLVATQMKDGDKPRVNIAKRNVDVICLTNDKAGMEAQKKTELPRIRRLAGARRRRVRADHQPAGRLWSGRAGRRARSSKDSTRRTTFTSATGRQRRFSKSATRFRRRSTRSPDRVRRN